MTRHPGIIIAHLLLLALAGCGKPASSELAPRTKTGAEEVAKSFFEALIREDWKTAYAALDSESRSWCSSAHFATLGQQHLRQMDFSPTEVNVSVNENGDRAVANAVYRGVSGTDSKQHRDGAALQRTPAGWAIVLRKNFGRDKPARTGPGKN
ncbi:MAG TPA: hypothetical protein VGL71_13060 [Urbifossiella sp.]